MPNTNRLGLKTNNGNDPFQLSDFTNNWNILDANPGIDPVTSSTRPVWGSGQYGRVIQEMDTNRQLLWTGSAWQEIASAVGAWSFLIAPQQSVSPGSSIEYSVGTINVPRPCNLMIITTVIASVYGSTQGQWLNSGTKVNGTACNFGSLSGYIQWSRTAPGNSSSDFRNVTWISNYVASAPGKYTLSHYGQTSSSGTSTSTNISTYATQVFVTAPNGGATTV